jgi:hypothetical protein
VPVSAATPPYIPGGALLASLVIAHQCLRNNLDELNAFFMFHCLIRDLIEVNLTNQVNLGHF